MYATRASQNIQTEETATNTGIKLCEVAQFKEGRVGSSIKYYYAAHLIVQLSAGAGIVRNANHQVLAPISIHIAPSERRSELIKGISKKGQDVWVSIVPIHVQESGKPACIRSDCAREKANDKERKELFHASVCPSFFLNTSDPHGLTGS